MGQQPNVRFLVYENLRYIGESAFYKDNVLIGKSREADLVLDHQSVAEVHALVELVNGQSFIINKNTGNGLCLNGVAVKKSEILPEDVIQLGPYSIIFRREVHTENAESQNRNFVSSANQHVALEDNLSAQKQTLSAAQTADGGYSILLINHYATDRLRRKATEHLSSLLRMGYAKVDKVLQKKQFLLKRNLDFESAQRLQMSLQGEGVLCMMVPDDGISSTEMADPAATVAYPLPGQHDSETCNPLADIIGDPPENSEPAPLETLDEPEASIDALECREGEPFSEEPQIFISEPLFEDEDEEDDEPYDAPFDLKDELAWDGALGEATQKSGTRLHITKCLGNTVVDAFFLAKGEKFNTNMNGRRFCLAEFSTSDEAFAYINNDLNGYFTNGDRRRTELAAFRSDEFMHHRRKQVYRVPLAAANAAVLYDGLCQYTICMADATPSPKVQVAASQKVMDWRHWAWSAGTHFFLLLCLSIYLFLQGIDDKQQQPRFVKIDIDTLKALEAKKELQPLPKVKPQPKPEPVRVAEKVVPPKKQVARKPVSQPPKSGKRKSKKQVASARQASRHPNAGGGFGEGNIADRNVNQAGILSILGKNALPGPSAAIASVTNIDAVKVPGATGKQFTVGGIKGSVGTGKIAIGSSGGGIVATKGSKQVLRSAGASGPGTVAALEKGKVGQGQVKGMVTAKMTRTVKVEGGMSREMVKRVIDQHMSEITYCYESALVGNPSISGRAIFEWKIKMDGSVGAIRIVASTINSHQVHDCIKNAIRTWHFPQPVGAEVVVSYPFVFDLVSF